MIEEILSAIENTTELYRLCNVVASDATEDFQQSTPGIVGWQPVFRDEADARRCAYEYGCGYQGVTVARPVDS
jgi:hypothetical protein